MVIASEENWLLNLLISCYRQTMETLFAIMLLAQQNGPLWQPDEVPSPIPVEMCVEVHRTEKAKQLGDKYKITIFNPPIDVKKQHALEEIRKYGLGVLKPCNSSNS